LKQIDTQVSCHVVSSCFMTMIAHKCLTKQQTACKSLVGSHCIIYPGDLLWSQVTITCLNLWKNILLVNNWNQILRSWKQQGYDSRHKAHNSSKMASINCCTSGINVSVYGLLILNV
jgi:tRNA(His) 5'-end guanylyltransferase